ncbi:MAG: hypothetical protein EBR30_03880 [Cytophagia bacterium]|nr:hypothetical protein [Cytophagia bacterium]
MNFKEFLTEASKEGANVHLEHLEDNVLNRGINGAREAVNFLRSLRDMLAGHAQSKTNVTTKWDGAPAVICGINPDNGKFFVGTKSVFNKEPKLNYTDEDIDRNHPGEGLNGKLKMALAYLPKLGIKGILQGDMMFTKGDIKRETIDGQQYIIFQPNTIVYAVPTNSVMAKKMLDAQLGIVFHTTYNGRTMDSLKASFNIDIGHLTSTKDVWFRDASFVDASGTVTFTEGETKKITDVLSNAGRVFQTINPPVLNRISTNETFNLYVKTFNNTKVRAGEPIKNTTQHTTELIKWIEDKLNKEILAAKKEDTKKKRIAEKTEIMRFFRSNAAQLKLIFDLMNLIVDAKVMIVRKLETIKSSVDTFVRTDTGFKVTGPEGFVAVDRLTGGALKLVDRMEFSQQNFNAAKNWSK